MFPYGARREQAHLPAEQPPACEDPRLPAAHAYPCRTRHPQRAPDAGPRATVGLSTSTQARHVVLPAAYRMRRHDEFAATIRAGHRARRGVLVAHVALAVGGTDNVPGAGLNTTDPTRTMDGDIPIRVGFVVPKAIGHAVDRNLVRRRLRHLMRDRLGDLPASTQIVVRVLPGAAAMGFSELSEDLDAALGAAIRHSRQPGGRQGNVREPRGA
jgi:ribonuclease P protein component